MTKGQKKINKGICTKKKKSLQLPPISRAWVLIWAAAWSCLDLTSPSRETRDENSGPASRKLLTEEKGKKPSTTISTAVKKEKNASKLALASYTKDNSNIYFWPDEKL